MVGLVETVRNRVLRFALDIKDQLGEDQESVAQLPAETVEKSTSTAAMYSLRPMLKQFRKSPIPISSLGMRAVYLRRYPILA